MMSRDRAEPAKGEVDRPGVTFLEVVIGFKCDRDERWRISYEIQKTRCPTDCSPHTRRVQPLLSPSQALNFPRCPRLRQLLSTSQ